MSFKDEMYSSLKTPEQVAQEKESAEVQAAKKSAQFDFDRIKDELKRKASQGEYWDDGTYKHISAIIVSSSLSEYFQRSIRQTHEKHGFFGNDIRCYAIFTVAYKNEYIAREYFKELDRLTKPEGITYEPIGKHERVLERDTIFNIPGSCKINCFDNSVHNLKIGLRASMKL